MLMPLEMGSALSALVLGTVKGSFRPPFAEKCVSVSAVRGHRGTYEELYRYRKALSLAYQ